MATSGRAVSPRKSLYYRISLTPKKSGKPMKGQRFTREFREKGPDPKDPYFLAQSRVQDLKYVQLYFINTSRVRLDRDQLAWLSKYLRSCINNHGESVSFHRNSRASQAPIPHPDAEKVPAPMKQYKHCQSSAMCCLLQNIIAGLSYDRAFES